VRERRVGRDRRHGHGGDEQREERRLESTGRELERVVVQREQRRGERNPRDRGRAAETGSRPREQRERRRERGDPEPLRRRHGIGAEPCGAREQQRPQEVAVALDALARVVDETEPVHEIAGIAVRDERVVAHPREQARAGDADPQYERDPPRTLSAH
jgi:hypothetical protein